jgi:phosphatidate cytidylyltransferase
MVRILTGLSLVAAVTAAIWFFSPWQLLLFAEAVLILAFLEYAALATLLAGAFPRLVAGAAACAACAAVAWPDLPLDVTLMAATIAMASMALTEGPPAPAFLQRLAAGLFPVLYLGLPFGALLAVRPLAGREAVLLLILAVAVSDTAQLCVGRRFGRTALAPVISPKKTVEGAVAGLVAGPAFLAIVGTWWLPEVALHWRVAVGVAVVATGILGDLFESMLKRAAGVKDSSGLLPGHGGVLDRIDSLLFAAPVFYLLVRALR